MREETRGWTLRALKIIPTDWVPPPPPAPWPAGFRGGTLGSLALELLQRMAGFLPMAAVVHVLPLVNRPRAPEQPTRPPPIPSASV